MEKNEDRLSYAENGSKGKARSGAGGQFDNECGIATRP